MGNKASPFAGTEMTSQQILVRIKGKFLALLEFRARTDATLQDFITNASRNACYTSKTIQNDIIELCGNYVREYTNAAVMKGGYFAIIADEVTDSSNNHTVLGICNRMLDISDPGNVFVKEQLFDFVQLERTNSESVCKKLMESYTLHSIDLNPRTPDVALPIQMLRYRDTFVTSIVTFCAIDNQI